MFLFSETMPLLIAGLAAYCVGMGKAGVPSLSLVFNSLMLLALPSKEAIGLVLLLLIAGDLAALLFYRKHAEWKVLLRLLPAIAVGLAIGTYLLSKISNELVRLVFCSVRYRVKRLPSTFQKKCFHGWLRYLC